MVALSKTYVLGFHEIHQAQVVLVGGKGAHLGELSRIEGIRVPAGFCVTTEAFQRILSEAPAVHDMLDRLSADPAFGVPVADMEAALDPHRFVGRAPQQVDEFLADVVEPLLAGHTELASVDMDAAEARVRAELPRLPLQPVAGD